MRRDLEKLNFKGNIASDSEGNIFITVGNYRYRYVTFKAQKRRFDFIVYRTNLKTGKETKVTKFCTRNISHVEVDKNIQKLVSDILL